jgi:2,4-dienoyl-CoA reductase-like NADH-dependent reductase (Old Yellow Enzyme family)
VHYITQLKEYTALPVVAVGSILNMEIAEKLLAEKKADIIAMGRAQFADTDFVRKCAESREGDIRRCLHDNLCIKSFFKLPEVVCAVNPAYKKE